jgi:hypothetical protein
MILILTVVVGIIVTVPLLLRPMLGKRSDRVSAREWLERYAMQNEKDSQ